MTAQQIAREALAHVARESAHPSNPLTEAQKVLPLETALIRIAALPPSPTVDEVCEIIQQVQSEWGYPDAHRVVTTIAAIRAKWEKP